MIVELENIHKSYDRQKALTEFCLAVPEGSFYAVLGPSSAGKTTALRVMCGLERADTGTLMLYGKDATNAPVQGRGLAMIFQTFALYPHLSVRDNLGYPLRASGVHRAEIAKRTDATAKLLRIQHRLDSRTNQLSGGEQQRVAIGRALIGEPRILLLDEPLTNLDAKLRDEMRVEFKRLHRELGITMIYATPDQLEATTMAQEIAIIDHGRIVAAGTPSDLYDNPPSALVAQLIGSPTVNLIRGRCNGSSTDFGFASIDFGGEPETSLYAIRPHDLRVDAAAPDFAATVTLVEPLGDIAVVNIDAAGHALRSVLAGKDARRVKAGDSLTFRIDRDRIRAVREA